MISVAVGVGDDIEHAVEFALDSARNPAFLIYLIQGNGLYQAAHAVERRFPGVPAIGARNSLISVAGSTYIPSATVLVFDESFEVSCGIVERLDECPVASIRTVQKAAEAVHPGDGDTLCLECCSSGNEERLVSTLNAALRPYGIDVAGWSVHSGRLGISNPVACAGNVYENACAFACIRNKNGRIAVFREDIYTRLDDVMHQVTKVGAATRTLIELDGEPAADVYTRELGISSEQISDRMLVNPFGRDVGGEIFISAMSELGARGELHLAKQLNLNDYVCILKLGDYRAIEQAFIDRVKASVPDRDFTLTIDCVTRRDLFKSMDFIGEHAANIDQLGPGIDIISDGEQYLNQHVNQTMVAVVFEGKR